MGLCLEVLMRTLILRCQLYPESALFGEMRKLRFAKMEVRVWGLGERKWGSRVVVILRSLDFCFTVLGF